MVDSFMQIIKKYRHNSLIRYIVVGGITYIFDIAILIGMYSGIHTSQAAAASASFWAGLIFSFILQKFLAFQDFKKELRAISRQAVWYGALVALNYFITITIVSLFPGRYIIFSRTLALLITTVWNFVMYRRIIFR